ncbi:hypothetical protein [Lactiplantibacillus herbarum]|uniref:hypothetical protein n=1 Tax=Lactiplantibacillus herbarum TaxID=1670446 RepID=UPI00064EE4A4|nr:hypothetical protein [Lactiplantibacillus herbarum]
MAKDKIKLDKEKFAYAVVNNFHPEESDDLKASKEILKRYLTAYYMAERFNTLEDRQFDAAKGLDFSLLASGIDAITLR